MKKILLVLLVCFGFCDSMAQYDEILNETWYLAALKHEGIDYDIPSNAEVEYVTLDIIPGTAPYEFYSDVCNTLFGYANIDDPPGTMVFTEVVQTLITCSLPVNDGFEIPYFNFFFTGEGEELDYDFSVIDLDDGSEAYGLAINKPSGDFAFYLSFPFLNSPEFSLNQISIYPNPVTDLVWVSNPNSLELKASIYALDGRKLRTMDVQNNQIEVTDLATGVYFLELSSENGRTVKRFVKN